MATLENGNAKLGQQAQHSIAQHSIAGTLGRANLSLRCLNSVLAHGMVDPICISFASKRVSGLCLQCQVEVICNVNDKRKTAYMYSIQYCSRVPQVPVICINVWPKLFAFVVQYNIIVSNAWYSPTVEHSTNFNLHCMTNCLQSAGPIG